MADNTTLAAGSGGDTLATDDIGGVKYPRSKIVIGADGTNDGDVSSANPLPIAGAVTNAGTFAVQINGDALTALQLLDNAVSGAGFNITQFAGAAVPIGGGVEATAVRVTIASDSTGVVSIDDNGGSLTVDGTVAISGTVTVAAHAVTNAGTFAVQAAQSGTWNIGTVTTVSTVTAVTTVGTVTTLTGSAIAHDAADSGNPHKIGARAVTSLSGLTLVSAADRTDLMAGVDGVLINRPHTNLEEVVTGNATNTDGTSTQCIAAQAAGIKTYLTSIVLCNTSASNITVDIKDGATTKISIPVPAGGGAIFNPPVPLPGSAATAWNFDPSAAATTVTCSMIGFRSKV